MGRGNKPHPDRKQGRVSKAATALRFRGAIFVAKRTPPPPTPPSEFERGKSPISWIPGRETGGGRSDRREPWGGPPTATALKEEGVNPRRPNSDRE